MSRRDDGPRNPQNPASPASHRREPARGSELRSHGRVRPGRRPVSMRSPEVLEIVRVRLRVIGEPTRVQIMVLLDQLGAATVQELTDHLPSTRQNTAKHLRLLYEAGMLTRIQDGNRVQYRLADWSALWLIDQITTAIDEHLKERQELLEGEP